MVADRHDDLVRAFDERGRRAGKAHADMHAAFRAGLRDADPAAYGSLVDEFRSATRAALHGVGPDIYARIDAGDRTALDLAVAFLVADPWFFSSGYVKANLIRRLKRAQLDEARCGANGCVAPYCMQSPLATAVSSATIAALRVRSPGRT